MNRRLSACPVCAEPLHITELACADCGTRLQGAFDKCRFCDLSSDQVQFLAMFLHNRGNLSSVGADLGVSYPTVAKRLDAVLAALELGPEPESASAPARPAPDEADRRKILEALDRGEMSADDATRKLREL